VNDLSIEKKLSDVLNDLSNSLDAVANFRMTLGCWAELKVKIDEILSKAKGIKNEWIDAMPLSENSVNQIKTTIIESARKLSNLSKRAENEHYVFRKTEDFQLEASEIGYLLLRVSYYDLGALSNNLSSKLQPISRDLHLIETERLFLDGGRSIKKLVERVRHNSDELSKIVSSFS